MTLNIALATFRGTGRIGDPFRPNVDGDFNGIIDLRPDKTVVDGLCLVAKSDDRFTGPGIRAQIGATDPGEPGRLFDGDTLGVLARTLLGNLFNKDFSSLTNLRKLVRNVVWNFHGDLQLDQSVNGFPIWLNGQMVDWFPVVQGGFQWSDPFTYSNGGLAAVSSGVWENMFGTPQVSGNAVQPNGAATYDVGRYNQTPYTVNNFSRIQCVTLTSGAGFSFIGARLRVNLATTDNDYQHENGWAGATVQRNLLRHDNGTATAIATSATAFPAFPYFITCNAVGSSISGLNEGDNATLGPVTDATYPSGRVGFMVYADDGATFVKADNWSGGDVDQTMRMHGSMGNGKRRFF